MNSLDFRAQILAAAHRWHWIAAAFLLGALLGGLVGLFWPAPYRATLDLYVGLNAARTPQDAYIAQVAGQEFRNLDDYKNWQMAQLDSLARSDEFLAETLTRLQAKDAFWHSVDVPALRAMLRLSWRNTGDWHFAAQHPAPERAAQAVSAWVLVTGEKTAAAVAAARELAALEHRRSALAQAITAAEARQRALLEGRAWLADEARRLADAPTERPLTTLEHWVLLAPITRLAAWDGGWQAALEAAPPLGSLPAAYRGWLLPIEALVESELSQLPGEIAALQSDFAALSAAYAAAAEGSRALSATLEVGQISRVAPQVIHLRPLGTLLLVGGLLGVFFLMGGWLLQISRKDAA